MGRRCVLEIQDGSQLTGSTNTSESESVAYIIKLPTANLRHSTIAKSQEVCLDDSNNNRQWEMAAETGNTYISEIINSTVKIRMTNLEFKTMQR